MAGDLNVVVLVGRLTRNAELKYSQNGMSSMLRFTIAVNSRRRGADGNWSDEPNFFDCVYFGRSAEAVNQYLEKGRQVSISGELRQNRWEQDGQTRSRVEIVVSQLNFLGSRGDGASGDSTGAYQDAGPYANNSSQQARGPQAGGAGYSSPSSNQNRFSGSFSRPQQNETVSSDYSVGGPESYGDDDVPF